MYGDAGLVGYFDGACEPVNPGGTMGLGALITEDGVEIWRASKSVAPETVSGQTTNNVAEYAALRLLLDGFLDAGLLEREIEILGDSRLVIEQLSGRWSVNEDAAYGPHAVRAKELIRRYFPKATFRWIPREENSRADELSKFALLTAGIRPRTWGRA